MKAKSELDRQREAALSLQIKSRKQDQSTHIMEMFQIKGQLYAFKEDSIFLVQTPDDIDPAREHPETKGATTQIYHIGTKHPVVSRTIIQAKKITDSVIFAANLSKEEILDRYFLFFKELATCNSVHENLVGRFLEEVKKVDEVMEASSNHEFVGDIPQILHLEDQTRNFFLTAHKAIKELSAVTDLFFPAKPPGQNFEQLCSWFLKNLGEDNQLYQMVERDREWLGVVWEIRNAIEHRNNPKYNLEVRNVEIAPNCKFYAPRWRYTLPKKRQDEFVNLLHDIEVYLDNMVSLGEELIVLCVQETWDKKFPFMIIKMPPEKLDPRCPVQYEVTINPEQLRLSP